MVLALQIFVLIGMLRAVVATERPFVWAGAYAAIWLVLGLVFGDPVLPVLVAAVFTFGYTALYFWLLVRFMGRGAMFWLVLIAGLLGPSLIRMAIS